MSKKGEPDVAAITFVLFFTFLFIAIVWNFIKLLF